MFIHPETFNGKHRFKWISQSDDSNYVTASQFLFSEPSFFFSLNVIIHIFILFFVTRQCTMKLDSNPLLCRHTKNIGKTHTIQRYKKKRTKKEIKKKKKNKRTKKKKKTKKTTKKTESMKNSNKV